MKNNIPSYRAKKIGSEEYIIGELTKLLIPDIEIISEYEQADTERWAYFIVKDKSMLDVGCSFKYCSENRFDFKVSEKDEIDPTTLAIHFPDMLDSNGNKIFASLQEDGKGGDIMQDDEYFGIAKYKDCQFVVEYEDCIDNIDNGNFEVIGIQE